MKDILIAGILIITTTAFSVVRLYGITENNFKAMAHIYTGMLLGYAFADTDTAKLCRWLAGIITVVEVIAFLKDKFG